MKGIHPNGHGRDPHLHFSFTPSESNAEPASEAVTFLLGRPTENWRVGENDQD